MRNRLRLLVVVLLVGALGAGGWLLARDWDYRFWEPRLVYELLIPSGSPWVSSGSGWRYRDEARGISKLDVRAGSPAPKISLLIKRPSAALPDLPLALDPFSIIEFGNAFECASSYYSAANVRKNDADGLKGR